MVSHPGREASGAVDRTRPAQPFFAERPTVARSEMGASAAGVCAVVRTLRLSAGHSRGQWWTLRIDRSRRAFAVERVVDGAGNRSRVHRSGPSRTERGARANASSDEERNDSTRFEQSTGAATANRSLGAYLQSDSPPRSAGAASPGEGLSFSSTK